MADRTPSHPFLPSCPCAQDAADSRAFQEVIRWRISIPSIFMVNGLEDYVSALEHRQLVDVSFWLYRFPATITI
jgi:hypothetical protein